MATSRDSDELQYYWEQWREETGKKIKVKYFWKFFLRCELWNGIWIEIVQI